MLAAERLKSRIHPVLTDLGAVYYGVETRTPLGYQWALNTVYGPLHITCHDLWVAMRFENKCALGGSNGKWNMLLTHKTKFPSLKDCDLALEDFKYQMRRVVENPSQYAFLSL